MSLSGLTFIFSFSLNCFSEATWSPLIGSTMVSAFEKRSRFSLNEHSSWVHTPVNAAGKNARSTLDLPLKLERLVSGPAVEGSEKSGAGWPTTGGIRVLRLVGGAES